MKVKLVSISRKKDIFLKKTHVYFDVIIARKLAEKTLPTFVLFCGIRAKIAAQICRVNAPSRPKLFSADITSNFLDSNSKSLFQQLFKLCRFRPKN
jgi:hypothetical protein